VFDFLVRGGCNIFRRRRIGDIATYSKENKKSFWAWAKCTNSLDRFAPGAKKYRQKFDLMFGRKKFRRVRHYKGPGGEIRKTVEIEI